MKDTNFPFLNFQETEASDLSELSESEKKAWDERMIEGFYRFSEGGFFYLILSGEDADRLNEEDEAGRKRWIAESVFKVFVAATHFVNVSDSAWEISQLVRATPEEVINYSKTPLWRFLLNYLGYKGNRTPRLHELKSQIPKPLREDYLISQVFQKTCPVRFITYGGFTDSRVNRVQPFSYILSSERELKKHDVILAFPKDRMSDVSPGIKINKAIAEKNLRPIERRRDRREVAVGARRGAIIECTMRNGLVITGENIWISKYNIVMRVGKEKRGKVILVYRHALLQFKVLKPPQTSETSDEFSEIKELECNTRSVIY